MSRPCQISYLKTASAPSIEASSRATHNSQAVRIAYSAVLSPPVPTARPTRPPIRPPTLQLPLSLIVKRNPSRLVAGLHDFAQADDLLSEGAQLVLASGGFRGLSLADEEDGDRGG